MKKVRVIIRPFELDDAKQALGDLNVVGMTVSEVTGLGGRQDYSEFYRGGELLVETPPMVCVEVVVPDDMTEKVARQLSAASRTTALAACEVSVQPVDDAVRIRTGERGNAALT